MLLFVFMVCVKQEKMEQGPNRGTEYLDEEYSLSCTTLFSFILSSNLWSPAVPLGNCCSTGRKNPEVTGNKGPQG